MLIELSHAHSAHQTNKQAKEIENYFKVYTKLCYTLRIPLPLSHSVSHSIGIWRGWKVLRRELKQFFLMIKLTKKIEI